MKLTTHKQNIILGGVINESTFTIKTNAKAFDILSTGLYKKPINAIVRELSCNAYDSHIAAGKKEQPFHIHLPTTLKPMFIVSDQGIGLSDEDIRGRLDPETNQWVGGIYTTYFDSNKTNSNDFIGAFGLGSKSPFAYTQTFTVKSIYNQTEYIYSVFLNEHNIPTVALMTQRETKEPNGVSIEIPVASKDFNAFRTAVQQELCFFDVKPTISGQQCEFDELNSIGVQKENQWTIYNNPPTYKSNVFREYKTPIFLVQGNVKYALYTQDIEHILTPISSPKSLQLLKKLFKQLCTHPYICVIYCDIGTLDVSASREQIRLSPQTVKYLQQRLINLPKEIFETIFKDDDTKIKTLSNWDYTKYCLDKMKSSIGYVNAQTILTLVTPANTITIEHVVNFIQNHATDLQFYSVTTYSQKSAKTVSKAPDNSVKWTHHVYNISPITVFLDDIPSGGKQAIKEFILGTQKITDVICITPFRAKCAKDKKAANTELQTLLQHLGHPTLKLTSELRKLNPTSTSKRHSNNKTSLPYCILPKTPNVHINASWQHLINFSNINNADISDLLSKHETVYYIPTYRNVPGMLIQSEFKCWIESPRSLLALIKWTTSQLNIDSPVIAVSYNQRTLKVIEQQPKMISLWDKIQTLYAQHANTIAFYFFLLHDFIPVRDIIQQITDLRLQQLIRDIPEPHIRQHFIDSNEAYKQCNIDDKVLNSIANNPNVISALALLTKLFVESHNNTNNHQQFKQIIYPYILNNLINIYQEDYPELCILLSRNSRATLPIDAHIALIRTTKALRQARTNMVNKLTNEGEDIK